MTNRGWSDASNAELYAEFAGKFPMYRRTSQDLVSRLDLENASLVVDLACGTGVTTEALLDALPGQARVVAVDGSAAMQAVARQRVTDARVSWVIARLERFDAEFDDRPGRADAIVCNSAIWQSDLAATFAAVRNVLRPGGQFAFNIGSQFVDLSHRTGPEEPPATPSLFDLMHAVAVYDYGFVPARAAGPRRPRLTEEQVADLLAGAGFDVRSVDVLEFEQPSEATYTWLKVPVFTEWNFGTLPYEQRMAALDKAYRRLRELQQPGGGVPAGRSQWLVVVAG